jgi:hypothetical protein
MSATRGSNSSVTKLCDPATTLGESLAEAPMPEEGGTAGWSVDVAWHSVLRVAPPSPRVVGGGQPRSSAETLLVAVPPTADEH